MSRPKPTVLFTLTDRETYKVDEVLLSEGIYAVFYDGMPINLRCSNSLVDYPGPKYKKVAFPNPGHAFNLAERLNSKFKSSKFEVVKLSNGEVVTKDLNSINIEDDTE